MAERLSRAQVANWREAFDVHDKDGDGALSALDLQLVFQQLGEHYTMAACEAVVEKYDTLGTGTLDFAEFLTMVSVRMRGTVLGEGLSTREEDEKRARATFARLARGADTLGLDAFRHVLVELGEDGKYDAERTFKALTGGRDRMTFAQFRSALRDEEQPP